MELSFGPDFLCSPLVADGSRCLAELLRTRVRRPVNGMMRLPVRGELTNQTRQMGYRGLTANRSLPGKQEYLGFGRDRFSRSIPGGIRSAGDGRFP